METIRLDGDVGLGERPFTAKPLEANRAGGLVLCTATRLARSSKMTCRFYACRYRPCSADVDYQAIGDLEQPRNRENAVQRWAFRVQASRKPRVKHSISRQYSEHKQNKSCWS